MELMTQPLRRYAQFSGRARPKEYWMYVLFLILCNIGLGILERVLGLGSTMQWAYRNGWDMGFGAVHSAGPLIKLFALATLIPTLAVSVRRLHDTDRSGWWLLLWIIPLFGWIIVTIFMIMGGTRGPNRFGPDPVESR